VRSHDYLIFSKDAACEWHCLVQTKRSAKRRLMIQAN
jgi:hypothetical protein